MILMDSATVVDGDELAHRPGVAFSFRRYFLFRWGHMLSIFLLSPHMAPFPRFIKSPRHLYMTLFLIPR